MKIKLWPEDAESTFEKAVYVLWDFGLPALLLSGYLCLWGVFDCQLSDWAKAASKGWHVFASVVAVGSFYFLYLAIKDRIQIMGKWDGAMKAAIFLLLTVISWISYGGWNV
jgi:hypothetical protein